MPMPRTLLLAVASLSATLAARPIAAQQPNADVVAFGLAGNYSAAARNYDAVAWNPANLALPGNSVASFNIAGPAVTTGSDPVGLRTIGAFNGSTIPASTKEQWLQQIGQGMERGRADGGVSILAMSVKNVALQIGTSGYADATLNQDAAEVLLFGNAGRTGTVRNFQFAGSSARGAAFTTGAASVGVPLPLMLTGAPDEIITIGLTGKYVLGNAMGRAEDQGSVIMPNVASVNFPSIYGTGADLGHGVGLDAGLAWHAGNLTAGVTVQNLLNTFAWDTTKLKSRLGTASFDGTTSASNFGEQPYALAPSGMRDAVTAERFRPTIGGGLAWRPAEALLLTTDARVQTGDGIQIGPRAQVGAGLDLSVIPFLPVRIGAARITDGWQAAAGIGLRMGDNHLGVSALVRDRGVAKETGAMVNLIAFY